MQSHRSHLPSNSFYKPISCPSSLIAKRDFCSSQRINDTPAHNTSAARDDTQQKSKLVASDDAGTREDSRSSRRRGGGTLASGSSIADAVVTTVIGLGMGE